MHSIQFHVSCSKCLLCFCLLMPSIQFFFQWLVCFHQRMFVCCLVGSAVQELFCVGLLCSIGSCWLVDCLPVSQLFLSGGDWHLHLLILWLLHLLHSGFASFWVLSVPPPPILLYVLHHVVLFCWHRWCVYYLVPQCLQVLLTLQGEMDFKLSSTQVSFRVFSRWGHPEELYLSPIPLSEHCHLDVAAVPLNCFQSEDSISQASCSFPPLTQFSGPLSDMQCCHLVDFVHKFVDKSPFVDPFVDVEFWGSVSCLHGSWETCEPRAFRNFFTPLTHNPAWADSNLFSDPGTQLSMESLKASVLARDGQGRMWS